MKNRILVTYATRAESTAEVAKAIAESLNYHGFSVDLKPVKEKPVLNGYQTVIMGSAIRMGRWLPEAMDFIKSNQQTLNQIPVAIFTVHMLNAGDDETSRTNRQAYLKEVLTLIKPFDDAFFTGKMDFSKLSFIDRFIAKMVKAVESDNRDWNAIRSWAPSVIKP